MLSKKLIFRLLQNEYKQIWNFCFGLLHWIIVNAYSFANKIPFNRQHASDIKLTFLFLGTDVNNKRRSSIHLQIQNLSASCPQKKDLFWSRSCHQYYLEDVTFFVCLFIAWNKPEFNESTPNNPFVYKKTYFQFSFPRSFKYVNLFFNFTHQ